MSPCILNKYYDVTLYFMKTLNGIFANDKMSPSMLKKRYNVTPYVK